MTKKKTTPDLPTKVKGGVAPKSSILTRLERLVPPVEVIAKRMGVAVEQAKIIHTMLCAAEDAANDLAVAYGEIIAKQAAFILEQTQIAKLANEQSNKAIDAQTILKNVSVFIAEEVVTAEYIISIMFTSVFAEAFGLQPIDRQQEMLSAIKPYIDALIGIDLVHGYAKKKAPPDTEVAKVEIEATGE